MLGVILSAFFILAASYFVDYRVLASEGSRKHWLIYGILYGVGFIVTMLYLLDPALPDPIRFIQGPSKPIHDWVIS